MRITKEAKGKNRLQILAAAQKLFSAKGYDQTTTRDISAACGIAKGTLFNYFKSKETLAMTMVAEAMAAGHGEFEQRRRGDETLAEELFMLVASELRALRPFHAYIGPVLASCMSQFAKTAPCPAGSAAREAHIAIVAAILARHGYELAETSVAATLYWSLYLGILAHWSGDPSANQADTLTLVDYTTQLFTGTVMGNIQPAQGAVANE